MTTDLDPASETATATPEAGIARWVAGLIGVLSVGTALGVGDLVAALVARPRRRSSPWATSSSG